MKRAGLSFWVILIPLLILSHFFVGWVLLGSAIGGEFGAQEEAAARGRQDRPRLHFNELGKQPSLIDAKPGLYDIFVRVTPSFPRHVVLPGEERVKLSVTGAGERKFPIDLKSFGLNGECCADNHMYLQITYMVSSPESEPEVGILATIRRIVAARPGGVSDPDQGVVVLSSLTDAFKYYRTVHSGNNLKKWRKYSWLDRFLESIDFNKTSSVLVRRAREGSLFEVNTDIDVSSSAEVRLQLSHCASGTKIQAIFENSEKTFPVPLILDRASFVTIPIGPIKARATAASDNNLLRLRRIIGYSDLSVEAVLACRPLRALETFATVDPILRFVALIAPESRVFDVGAGVRVLRVPLDSISDRADWGRMIQSLDVVVRPRVGVVNTDILLLNISLVDPTPADLMPRASDCNSLQRDFASDVRQFTLGPCPVWVRSFNFGGLDPAPLSGESSDLETMVTASSGVRYRMDRIGLQSVTFSLKGADDWLTVSVLPAALQRPSQPAALELVFDPRLQVTTADNKIVRPGLFFFTSPQDLKFRITKPDSEGSGRFYKFMIRYAGGNVSGTPRPDEKAKEYCLSDGALQICQTESLENITVGDAGIEVKGPTANILRIAISEAVDLPERSAVQILGNSEGNPVKFELELTTADQKVARRVLKLGEVMPLFPRHTSIKSALLKIIPPEGDFKVSLQNINFLGMAPDNTTPPLNVIYSVSRNLSLPVDDLAFTKGVQVKAERGGLTLRRGEATSAVDPIVQWSSQSPASVSELSSLVVDVQGDSYNQSHMTLEIVASAAGKARISRYNMSGRDKLTIPKSEVLPPSPDGAAVPTFVFRLFAEAWGKPSPFSTVLAVHAVANVVRPGRDLASLFPILGIGGQQFYLDRRELDASGGMEYPIWIKLGRVELTGPASVVRGNNPIFHATDLLLEPVN